MHTYNLPVPMIKKNHFRKNTGTERSTGIDLKNNPDPQRKDK
jgi:hypothetical protein